jgi:hypothetical protein
MWFPMIMMLVAALVAGTLAWHYADRIDRQTQSGHWHPETGEGSAAPLALLAALTAALCAATLLQFSAISKLAAVAL